MRKFLDIFSWGFAVLFAVPTLLIMVSWNSLPGDILYPVKRAFEQVMLLVAKPSYAAEANLNVQYTTRRMGEVKVLLSKEGPNEGLTYLSQQIQATKVVIERAPNKTVQKQIAKKYITTLQAVSQELKAQEMSRPQFAQPNQTAETQGLPVQPTSANRFYIPTPTTHANPSNPDGGQNPEPTAVTQPVSDQATSSQDQTASDVTDVQDQIQETINDLQQLSAAASVEPENPVTQPQETATPQAEPTSVPPTAEPTRESGNGNNGNHFGNASGESFSGNGNGDGQNQNTPDYIPPATTAPAND